MVRLVVTGQPVTEALTGGAQDPTLPGGKFTAGEDFSLPLHGAAFQIAFLYPKAPG